MEEIQNLDIFQNIFDIQVWKNKKNGFFSQMKVHCVCQGDVSAEHCHWQRLPNLILLAVDTCVRFKRSETYCYH